MFRLLCKYLGLVLFVVGIIIIIRTVTFSVRTDAVRSCRLNDDDYIQATEEVIERFQKALRFRTISTNLHQYDTEELQKMVDFVHKAFPVVHSSPLVTHDVVNNYSLLYKVQGSNPELRPYMVCAHLDVVPVDEKAWDEDPFGANIKDGFIYARGTIDVKHILMGVLEATEFLLKSGHKPKRSFYLAFGHDEEVTGLDGASKISEFLYSRGVRDLEFLIDEGTTILNNLFPGVSIPIAVVGTSEKGSLNVELSVTGTPGHSSMPAGETTIATLARAITRLEENPHPNMFGTGPEKDTFTHLASSLSLPFRTVITNLWLFGPVVSRLFSRIPSLNAIVRTVTSVTMVNGGVKVNVLPPSATALVNHRIHPAQTVEEVLAYDRKIINDDRVKLRVVTSMEPHPMSPYGDEDFGYQTIKNSIRQIWTNATVVPGVMIGNTDTVHYIRFTKNIYRFSPTFMYPEDLKRFHGNNERLSINNYEQVINFYYHLLVNADEVKLPSIHKHGEEL
ncbi:N-fatty-acyl-amino acid synthase/hydrolase PM20D1-like [Saccostrea echinata]|uniref:N-fatty-acyl-amino acid synthase/hydrolase PM20D1-like n=1 Tax=Saccostrea echinata TaxID=191078 RepID=UPI002A813E2C|nr:N-fatty-acyl-amino acid synthase/hydrolase PM20D1-like [Saccostrea echinata]